MKLNSCI